MAFCRLVFPLLVLSVISSYASHVPVIIWGDLEKVSSKPNPLAVLSSEQFGDIVQQELKDDPVTIVFVEETLSVEDFSHKNYDGNTPFQYLQSIIQKAIYLPSVENPLGELKSLGNNEVMSLELTGNGLSEDIPTRMSDSSNIVIINLKDAEEEESRPKFLRRHDEFMRDTLSEMRKHYENVVAIYTAVNPSWILPEPPVTHSRVRRDTSNSSNLSIENVLIKVKTITLEGKNVSTLLENMTKSNTIFNDTFVNAELDFPDDIKITLNFNKNRGYWFFDSVNLATNGTNDVLLPVGEEVFAILGFSYRCAQHVKFASVNQSNDFLINFENLKVQPFFENIQQNETVFGDSFNCVGFFTAPIWAGLFVASILLFITFYGIMMMLDIRTMDRFDDPKGKTITIIASE